jgi:folate-dependent phosphoribosylglycinamide formyltransferase PurN
MVIVSGDKSDLFFANQLAKSLNVVGIVVESQTPQRDTSPLVIRALKYASTPGLFIRKVFEVFDRRLIEPRQPYNDPANSLDFGKEGLALETFEGVEILHTRGVNAINSPEYVTWIRDKAPDVIAVCGASILKRDLLQVPRHGVLNLHGGLSQFYRGLYTTDWAVHNGEPECVGATVHFVSEGVDDGDIVYQARPAIEQGDNPNRLYEKVVRLGVKMMIRAIQDLEQGKCNSVSLERKGRLYLYKDFDVKAKRATWRGIEDRVIEQYLSDQQRRDERVTETLINDFNLLNHSSV